MKKIFVSFILFFIVGCSGVRGYDGSGQVCVNATWMGLSLIELVSPCSSGSIFFVGETSLNKGTTSYQPNDEQLSRQLDYQLQSVPKVPIYQQPIRDLEDEQYKQKMMDYENRHYNRYRNDYLRCHR